MEKKGLKWLNQNFDLGGNLVSLRVAFLKPLFVIVTIAAFTRCSPPPNKRLDVKGMPLIHTVDERFMSFQIGMSHLTGGETWTMFDSTKKEGEAEQAKAFEAAGASK